MTSKNVTEAFGGCRIYVIIEKVKKYIYKS